MNTILEKYGVTSLSSLFLLNVSTALILYFISLPLHFIPSDDVVYSGILKNFVACFDEKYFCLPKTESVYTRPVFTIVASSIYFLFGNLLKLNTLEAIGLLSFICTGINVFLLQLLIRPWARNRASAYFLVYVFFFLNSTFSGINYWWGYVQFSTMLLLGLFLVLFRIVDELVKGPVEDTPGYVAFLTSKKVWVAIVLTVIAVFTHLATWPYVFSWYVGSTLAVLFLFPRLARTTNPPTYLDQFSNLCLSIKTNTPLRLMFSLILTSAIAVIVVDLVAWLVNGGKASYLMVFVDSLSYNIIEANRVKHAGRIMFYSTLLQYYFSAELPLTVLFGSSLFFLIVSRWVRSPLLSLVEGSHSRLLAFFSVSVIPILIIGLGPSTKLVRSFFPTHVAAALLCVVSLFLAYESIKDQWNSRRIPIVLIIPFIALISACGFYLLSSVKSSLCNYNNFLHVGHSIDRTLGTTYLERFTAETQEPTRIAIRYSPLWRRLLEETSLIEADVKDEDIVKYAVKKVLPVCYSDQGCSDQLILPESLEDCIRKNTGKGDGKMKHGSQTGSVDNCYISYVVAYPEITAAYHTSDRKESIASWGKKHYERYGRSGNRTLMFGEIRPGDILLTDKDLGPNNFSQRKFLLMDSFSAQTCSRPLFVTFMQARETLKFLSTYKNNYLGFVESLLNNRPDPSHQADTIFVYKVADTDSLD